MLHHHGQAGSLYTRSGQRKYLTPLERTHFIDAASNNDRDDIRTLCLILAFTGCRISEALALTAASVEVEAGFIAFRTLKRRNNAVVIREVPVPHCLLQEIERTHRLRDVLPTRKLWQLSRSQAWRHIKRVMQTAGVAPGHHATPKGLRHGFGLHAIQRAVPVTLVQKWLGHASLETTCIYLQIMGDEERDMATRMWSTGQDSTG